jgi:hypothetical protein
LKEGKKEAENGSQHGRMKKQFCGHVTPLESTTKMKFLVPISLNFSFFLHTTFLLLALPSHKLEVPVPGLDLF